MPIIGLTTFIDFLTATGISRVRKVRAAKISDNERYDIKKDFYKKLRESVNAYHKDNIDESDFLNLPNSLSDKKKKSNFPPAIEGLLKFEKKSVANIEPGMKGEFSAHGLYINVNPECTFTIANKKVTTKLWFKTDVIPKSRVPLILGTMKLALRSNVEAVGILDCRRAKLHEITVSTKEMEILLKAEAAAFMEIWTGLGGD